MGRHSWTDRNTVEECRALGISDLKRMGVFNKAIGLPWILRWTNSAGEDIASMSCMLVQQGTALRFNYSFTKRDSEEKR